MFKNLFNRNQKNKSDKKIKKMTETEFNEENLKEDMVNDNDELQVNLEEEIKNESDRVKDVVLRKINEHSSNDIINSKESMDNNNLKENRIDLENNQKEVALDREDEVTKKPNFFSRLKEGLSKTRKGITEKVDLILNSYKKVEEELFDDLEEVLITADVGVTTSMKIIDELRNKVREKKINEVSEVRKLLKEVLHEMLNKGDCNKLEIEPSPAIILIVGVNGVGKTTTIGKLSARLKSEGKKVLIAAGDTFRAAAIEQLQEWGNRAGVGIISHQEGSDPAAVIYDGIQAAKARNVDVLICDTAGRLHNKKNLMNELSKIFRVVEREYPDAKKEVLLVVDATTGQNAVAQAKVFKEACDITGIVLTKLDGTAKGGVVLAVQSEIEVPVKLVGVGEQINDLQEFDPTSFVNAIFEE